MAIVINEFLANNNNGLLDVDNDRSDWIELRNTGGAAVNLAGYSLTDDQANLTKWQFPSVSIPANGYLVVFASGKNRAVAGQQLHTNFSLESDVGEYLALVQSGGTTVLDSFAPYPPQEADVSYGRGSTSSNAETLVGELASVKAKIPTSASAIDSTWRGQSFTPDGTWLNGLTGVGYDIDGVFNPYIQLNVEDEMGLVNSTAYIRLAFNTTDPSSLSAMTLRMRYDDGYIAYLNGVEIARKNAVSVTPAWNSAATANHSDSAAVVYEDVDVSAFIGELDAGPNVLAIHGLNTAANSLEFLISPILNATRALGASFAFMATPTPGAANSQGTLGFVADTSFTVDRGFFDAPFNVGITTSTSGAQIRYTLDGTAPTATTGTVYTGPINIATTKTLRAAAFKTGWTPTDVDTQTYIFLDHVLQQSGSGLPPVAAWGSDGPDWAMDQTVVGNPAYSGTIKNDLKAVPSISLVMPWSDWFGSGGIYISGEGVERAGSMELLSPTGPGSEEFHIDAALEIKGNSSTIRWNNDKLSIGVTFKAPFGPTKLDHPLFTHPMFDGNATTEFDKLVLDAVYDESWMASSSSHRQRAKFIQDQVIADFQNLAGGVAPHGTFTHLYLNGLYWGLYYLHEVPDESFGESYTGGNKDDYDVIKHNSSTVVSGSGSNYSSLLSAVRQSMTVAANYNAVVAKLDIDDFIDYMIINQYGGNTDWASQNWYASFNRVDPSGRWRFHSWDAEFTFRPQSNPVVNEVNVDVTLKNDTGGPTEIFTRLIVNSEFKLRFADRVQKLMFNGGILSPTGAAAVYQARMNQVDEALVGESARWGDNHDTPAYTRDNWLATQNGLLTNYFPNRTGVVVGQYNTRGWMPSLGAPIYSQHGGTVSPGYQLTISKPGGAPGGAIIYYTLDGSDPRVTGGAISGTATQYAGPITLSISRQVKARVYNGGSWSAVLDATFLMPSAYPVRISEIHYNPANHAGVVDAQDIEWIELLNTGSSSMSLQNMQITTAIDPYTFGNVTLAPGARIVVPRSIPIFDQVYGTGINRTSTSYTGRLDNAGETLTLLGPLGEVLQTFTYDDNIPWPTTPDGAGPSLEIINPLGDPNDPANWQASAVTGGTPAVVGDAPVVVSASFVHASAHSITVQFNHAMDASTFATTDLTVQLLPGGPIFHPSSISFSNAQTAVFAFATPLADGNYHATLLANSVKNSSGVTFAGPHDLDFFALSADANHDRHVDAADQAILTAHMNQPGSFADGDFDRNGMVNSADQTMLNNNWHLWLPAQGALSLPVTSGNDTYRLRRESASRVEVYAGLDVTPTYRVLLGAVTSLSIAGGVGNDTLTFDASNGLPLGAMGMNFDGGNGGSDVLNIIGASGADVVTFSSIDVTFGSTLTHGGIETRTFKGNGGGLTGDTLTITGGVVALTAIESFAALTISPDATLDLRSHGFARNYSGATPLTSIEQTIQLGRGDGTWSGDGIITTLTDAHAPSYLTTLGLAEASDVVNFAGNPTALWQGVTVSPTTVLVRYTFAGDADLDRVIDGDDYFFIDSHYPAGPITYGYGDFDHNNRVDADDYFLIDANYNKPGVVVLAGAPAPPAPFSFAPIDQPAARSALPVISAHKRLWDDEAELLDNQPPMGRAHTLTKRSAVFETLFPAHVTLIRRNL